MSTSGLNLSSLGLNSSTASSGSGIDVTAVVSEIIDSERGPEQIWKQQQTDLQNETSALSSMNSNLTTLSDKATALNDFFGVLASKTATSSQSSILTASASTSAASSNHLIVVSNLASTGTAYSDPLSDANTTFGAGAISLQVGSASHDIQVDSSNDTLSTMVTYINKQNWGITASVVNDASGSRLALVSNKTGDAGDIAITLNTSGLTLNKGAKGQNAVLSVDGVPFSSTTNTVAGAISGVTLNLVGASASTEVQLTVGPDQASAKQAVSEFVDAYNAVISAINKGTAFNTSVPSGAAQINPVVFWEHSLGCALVCRHFARKITFNDPEKAYLGGLLHDLGIIVNLWILPKEFGLALELAKGRQVPLHEAELEILGLTHCESGKILAERWALTSDLIAVVSHHHDPQAATSHKGLVALVGLSDLLCRMGEIGHGYAEMRQVNFLEETGFSVLQEECPSLKEFDWARFTFELEGYLDEVRRLVRQLYGTA